MLFGKGNFTIIFVVMETFRYFVEFSYCGTPFHGWQRQPNAYSIQEIMETSLHLLYKKASAITAAGRTDTGVHARKMVAHFDLPEPIENFQHFIFRYNQILPKEIAIHQIKKVSKEAHARFDALSRTYEYHISHSKSVFYHGLQYSLFQPLNIEAMNKAALMLLKYEDFECFSKSHTDVKTFICKLTQAKWTNVNDGYVFTITANRFLRNMVRAIVGTLVEIGLNKKKCEDIASIIESKNRSLAGYSVPAQGLFLTDIQYPESIYM